MHQYYKERATYIRESNPLDVFQEVVERNAIRIQKLWNIRSNLGAVSVSRHDARTPFPLGLDTVEKMRTELIITSPPYGSAQKNTRSTKLSLGWLSLWESLRLSELDVTSIGREHYKKGQVKELPQSGIAEADSQLKECFDGAPVRCVALAQYLIEMKSVMQQTFDTLCEGGHLVLIMGDNSLRGQFFPTARFIMIICQEIGFVKRATMIDGIKSRGLLTRRHATSGIINHEHIMILRKPNE